MLQPVSAVRLVRLLGACALLAGAATAQAETFRYPFSISGRLGDVDGDGARDWWSLNASTPRGWVAFWVSGRSGDVLHHLVYGNEYPLMPRWPLGDADGDGVADVPIGRGDTVTLHSGATAQTVWQFSFAAGYTVHATMGRSDLGGDGVPDVVALAQAPAPTPAYELTALSGATGAVLWTQTLGLQPGERALLLHAFGDLDGDGADDHGIEGDTSSGSDTLTLFNGVTGDALHSHAGRPIVTDPTGLDTDLDGDGCAEYLVPVQQPTEVELRSGRTGALLHTWPLFRSPASAGDWDGDGVEDVVANYGGLDETTVLSGATFLPLAGVAVDGIGFGIGDADGDGRGELAVRDYATANQTVTVYGAADPDLLLRHNASYVGWRVQHTLLLSAPAVHAGKTWLVLGSLSGTAPGFAFGGQSVPLNPDPYFAALPSLGVVASVAGVLDASGRAGTALRLPALPGSLAGLVLHHAYVVLGPSGLDYASRAVPLSLF